jgi:hypothetical protein
MFLAPGVAKSISKKTAYKPLKMPLKIGMERPTSAQLSISSGA